MDISFASDSSSSPHDNEAHLAAWLARIAAHHKQEISSLEVAWVSVEAITEMNIDQLDHDYPTDIITFDYRDTPAQGPIEGELYICPEVVYQNALDFGTDRDDEVLRVLAHGLLHLIGFDDHDDEDIAAIRQAEDEAIAMFHVEHS